MADVTRLLLETAAPKPGEAVLDIGCGTGATSLAFAQAVAPDGRVVGLDVSAPLLRQARTRSSDLAVTFVEGDAQVHPVQPEFDLVTSRFGVMFFDDPAAAFGNMSRALRPGGRVVFATWAMPTAWFELTAEAVASRLGSVAPPDPSLPGPMSLADPARVAGLLKGAGLTDVDCVTTRCMLTPGGLEEAVALSHSTGPVLRVIEERGGSPDDLAAIDATFADSLRPYMTETGLKVPARVNLSIGWLAPR
jgi:SAM-dependent methyltransferase